jgi:hypothetical protein
MEFLRLKAARSGATSKARLTNNCGRAVIRFLGREMIVEIIAGVLAVLAAFALLVRWHQKRNDVLRHIEREDD